MKTKADTLDKILDDYALDECRKIYPAPDKNKFRKRIIALFKEYVPEETRVNIYWNIEPSGAFKRGWNDCRENTLKNIEEMGK